MPKARLRNAPNLPFLPLSPKILLTSSGAPTHDLLRYTVTAVIVPLPSPPDPALKVLLEADHRHPKLLVPAGKPGRGWAAWSLGLRNTVAEMGGAGRVLLLLGQLLSGWPLEVASANFRDQASSPHTTGWFTLFPRLCFLDSAPVDCSQGGATTRNNLLGNSAAPAKAGAGLGTKNASRRLQTTHPEPWLPLPNYGLL